MMFPTPRSSKMTDENEETWQRRHAQGKVSTPPLALAVRMIPTPTCGDSKSAARVGYEGGAMKPGVTLTDFARIWPTPTANDGRNATRKIGDFQSLTRSVMLPTPTCQDANNNGSTSQQNRQTLPLNAVVTNHDPAMRLNPEWVEELMGWPIGWTAAPPDSGPGNGKASRE